MDSRTKKKLLGKASLLMHLIQEHHGAIPAGADYADVYREGLDAINALALPVVVRHAAVKKNHRLREIVRDLSFEDFSVSENWPVVGEPLGIGRGLPNDAEVKEVMQDPAVTNLSRWHVEGEQWGIGRGLPTGDVQ